MIFRAGDKVVEKRGGKHATVIYIPVFANESVQPDDYLMNIKIDGCIGERVVSQCLWRHADVVTMLARLKNAD